MKYQNSKTGTVFYLHSANYRSDCRHRTVEALTRCAKRDAARRKREATR